MMGGGAATSSLFSPLDLHRSSTDSAFRRTTNRSAINGKRIVVSIVLAAALLWAHSVSALACDISVAGGEDPARPELRQSLGECKLKVLELREGAERLGALLELWEPEERLVEQARKLGVRP